MKKALFILISISLAVLAIPALALENQGAPGVAGDLVQSQGSAAQTAPAPKAFDQQPAVGAKATCPVMNHEFTVTEKTQFSKYKGKYYAFCCGGCKPKFDAEPEKYVTAGK